MAALSHSESRRKYSWWWDSHISPKNSKWLQENLTDMDVKVKSMIKLIEEDADSFARRAEMYYEQRPELIRLVEEFYRAYRALAERYNHATGELRHAHRALARAFPDHLPPSANSLDSEDDQANGKAEQVVWDLRAEKKGVLMKYHKCMEKLPGMEVELDDEEKHVKRLDEKANQAEVQFPTLKEALVQLEAEKNAILVKCEHKIADLEDMLSRMGEDMKGLDMKAVEAESQARALKDDISRLEVEKEAIFRKYEECLGKILALEDIVSVTENKGILLREKAERAEDEVHGLKKVLADLNEEREASALRYKCSLDKISKLEKGLSSARENVECLNHDVLVKNAKLEMARENCEFLERSNLSLKTEAENLAKRIATKDQELSQKQVELEKLTTCLGDENFRCAQVEATLQSLQNLHARSQDDQKTLKVELDNVLQTLKDLESNKRFLEVEVQHVRDENRFLTQNNAVFVENMQSEILGLREIKQRLEKEMSEHIDLSDSLHKEIMRLKEEITRLNGSYHTIIDQLEVAGLSLNCFGTSVKCLRDENSNLRQISEQGVNENAILSEKLANMQELLNKTVISEEYMSSMNTELESSRHEAKALQESFRLVEGEKIILVVEKASLLSQLETITETMHKLLEKNDVLENSLSAAKVELEGLREKSKGLEEICELLKNERSFLLNERGMLVSKLETVERKLKSMEKRYSGLEKKYTDLEKEKRVMHSQINELEASLNIEKHEWASSNVQNETKMAALKDKIYFLQEENNRNRKEFEAELEKSLKGQFEIAILQKLIKDMEEKNCSLVIECQKHIEASKLAEKLISELESEGLEQQVESEILLDEIEQLRLSMYQIFRALETTPDCEDQTENKLSLEHLILGNIEDLKSSVMGHEDDKELLRVENSVLLTLLEQLESKSVEIESQKMFLEEEIKTMAGNLEMTKNDRDKVFDLNMKLKSDANESNQHAAALEAKIGDLQCGNTDFHKDYALMKEAYSQMNRDNSTLLKMCCALKEEKDMLKQNDDTLLIEYLATSTESAFLSSFGEEKNSELNLLLMDLDRQNVINRRLVREMGLITEKVEFQGTENLLLKVRVNKFERGIQGMRECNAQMEKDIVWAEENLHGAEAELLDSEVKLAAAEKLNLKMFAKVDELEKAIQSSEKIKDNLEKNLLELSENNTIQNMEIESLRLVKTNMDTELSHLRKELRDKILREQIASSELQERNNELELWEAGASGYYFDLQMMSIHEVLLNSNLRELTGLYQNLEKENVVKTSVIEEMKGTTCLMEKEIRELKSELRSYAFAVAALRDDVTLLENNAFLQIKINSSHEHAEGASGISETSPEHDTLTSLQNLHTKIKTISKLMEQRKKPMMLHRRSSSRKQGEKHVYMDEMKTQPSRPIHCLVRNRPDLPKTSKPSEPWNPTTTMKDIPLDRDSADKMLELWENPEMTIGESLLYKMTDMDIVFNHLDNSKCRNNNNPTDLDVEKELRVKSTESERRILERLTSDWARLENLRTTLGMLRAKLEDMGKKGWKSKRVDVGTVWEQLAEAEDMVEYLAEVNGQLVRNMESCPSRRKVGEQARRGSERIGRLQLELQKIHFILFKMDDERTRRRSKSVVLRDFIGKKRSKAPLCGWLRRPSSASGGS